MSVKTSLLIATALLGLAGLARAQNAPLSLTPAPRQANAAAPFRLAPPEAGVAAQKADPGLKFARPQLPEARPLPAAPTVDESALRFYASQRDTARVAAEIRRLKALHPAWQPPENLFAAEGPQIDEQPLWDLFALGRYDDVAAQIETLRAENPGYMPSSDLAAKLAAAQRRHLVVAASDQRDWEQVVALATENQDLLVCREMDVLWRVAEAFAQLDDKDRAFDVYRYILSNCDNAKERLATIQKATLVMPASLVEQLMAAGKRRRDGGNEFDVVRLDVVRRSIGAFASGKGGTPPSAREIKQIETSAREGRNADDASLLGWYAFQNKDFAAARDWFKTARDHSRDPKHLEGLILSLRNLGELEQARSVAQENLATGPLVRKAFIEIVATEITGGNAARPSPAVLTAMEGAIEQERSANGAQALGWYYFLQSDFKPAKLWFDKSSGWNPSDESILGQALVLQRLGDRKAYAQFLSEKKAQYPTLAKLAASDGARTAAVRNRGGPGVSGAVVKQAVGLYESGKYREAAEFMDRNQAKLDSGMNALRGWAHFHANNFDQAEKIFKKYSSVKGTDHGAFLAHIAGSSIPARWYQ